MVSLVSPLGDILSRRWRDCIEFPSQVRSRLLQLSAKILDLLRVHEFLVCRGLVTGRKFDGHFIHLCTTIASDRRHHPRRRGERRTAGNQTFRRTPLDEGALGRPRLPSPLTSAVMRGYDICPGPTTMQGRWAVANRAQAALAVAEDKFPRRALYTTAPPKGVVGRSSI